MSKALIPRDASTLVLVDYQARLMPALFESEAVLANALRLAQPEFAERLMRAHLGDIISTLDLSGPARIGSDLVQVLAKR